MKRIALALALTAVCAAPATAARTASLPPLPARWPTTLQIGMADAPGEAKALHQAAQFGFRYQYLAGGVNTGNGWSTWNPNGSFVTRYDDESWANDEIPVFSYYQLLQSKPAGGDEKTVDLAHLKIPAVMDAYWKDVRLFFTAREEHPHGRAARRARPLGLHRAGLARTTTPRPSPQSSPAACRRTRRASRRSS